MNYETELPETSNGVPRYVVFSHGFGVRKDGGGGGIFTDIAKGLGAEYVPVMFDYNDVSVDEKILHTHPFSDQVRKLNATISEIRNQDPEAVIDLVAHSQGCIVAALANPDGIRKAVLLAPPFVTDIRRSLARYEGKPGAVINLDGESRLPRTDGTVTIVSAAYWKEREALNYPGLYEAFSAKTELYLVRAQNDEVFGDAELPCVLSNVSVISIPGTHDFTGSFREGMVRAVTSILS
ncbi:MAG: alpha/beta hydrolase [Candidatus Moranbacteria bacterium]|nr:alpha/beta hydrolase [Candidatus Moranbacteria bacterium]